MFIKLLHVLQNFPLPHVHNQNYPMFLKYIYIFLKKKSHCMRKTCDEASLYYFNELYVKIETKMLGEL